MKRFLNRKGLKVLPQAYASLLSNWANSLLLVVKYSTLLVLLFLLASNESANPKVGNTSIEFYSNGFRQGILGLLDNHKNPTNVPEKIDQLTAIFFSNRQYMPAWTLNFEVGWSYHDLVALLVSANEYGLFTEHYSLQQIIEFKKQMESAPQDEEKLVARIKLEQMLTKEAFRFMTNLAMGLNVKQANKKFTLLCEKLPPYLTLVLEKNTLKHGMLELQPKNKQYQKLQRAQSNFVRKTKLDAVEYTAQELKENNALVLEMLNKYGLCATGATIDTVSLANTLKKFQLLHCLDTTGIPDTRTVQALSKSTEYKFRKIALNMDRLRKDELKNENCILVNIPEFRLQYINHKGITRIFKVVVGKTDTQTPELISQIERIVTNPYWTVPKSITHNEIIPHLKKDSTYLKRNGFSVIDDYENLVDEALINWDEITPQEFDKYWIRQTNNRSNALGVVKFVFPNKYRVYLHDTQSKKLFKQNQRAFSHGCVRVENPVELAQIVIADYYNSGSEVIDVDKEIKKQKRSEIKLREPLPIFIKYYTVTSGPDDNVIFHQDIYTKDEKAMEELFGIGPHS